MSTIKDRNGMDLKEAEEIKRGKNTQSESESCSTVSNSLQPYGLNSSGQNTGIGSLSLLQVIFPIQGSNPGLHNAGRFFTS